MFVCISKHYLAHSAVISVLQLTKSLVACAGMEPLRISETLRWSNLIPFFLHLQKREKEGTLLMLPGGWRSLNGVIFQTVSKFPLYIKVAWHSTQGRSLPGVQTTMTTRHFSCRPECFDVSEQMGQFHGWENWLIYGQLAGLAADHNGSTWSLRPLEHLERVGSNSTRGMDVCVRLFSVCALLCVGRGLETGWSPVLGVLPTV
jgi:hypothetical protein